MKLFERAFARITSFGGVISLLATIAMMLLVAVDVATTFFGRPVDGVAEITVMLMVVLVFMGIPECARDDEMIRVDIFRKGRVLDHFSNGVILVMGLIASWQTVVQGLRSYRLDEVSMLLRIPNWPFIFIVALGFFLMGIAAVVLEHRLFEKKRDTPEGSFRDEYGVVHSEE